jgi:phytoene synthase
VLLAVADAARRFSVRRDDLLLVVAGCLQDLDVTRYATWDGLRDYCHKVAGAVGLACLEVFGHDRGDEDRPIADDLGLAMQVANIIRDVDEDLARDRIYLPAEDLARFQVTEADLLARKLDDRVRALFKFEVARARELFASGARLAARLPRRSRSCPLALAGLYGAILDEIERRDHDVFTSRVGLSKPRKLWVASGALARSLVG